MTYLTSHLYLVNCYNFIPNTYNIWFIVRSINLLFSNVRGVVPAERDEERFEYSDIGVVGACMHSVFVSCFEMIMFI